MPWCVCPVVWRWCGDLVLVWVWVLVWKMAWKLVWECWCEVLVPETDQVSARRNPTRVESGGSGSRLREPQTFHYLPPAAGVDYFRRPRCRRKGLSCGVCGGPVAGRFRPMQVASGISRLMSWGSATPGGGRWLLQRKVVWSRLSLDTFASQNVPDASLLAAAVFE